MLIFLLTKSARSASLQQILWRGSIIEDSYRLSQDFF